MDRQFLIPKVKSITNCKAMIQLAPSETENNKNKEQ